MHKVIAFKYLFIVASMYIFVFQNYLQTQIIAFKYFDEIFSLLLIPILILSLKQNNTLKINKKFLWILIYLFIIIIIGGYSNFRYNYQNSSAIFGDILLNVKGYFTLIGMGLLFVKIDINKYKKRIGKHVTIIINTLFIFLIGNYFFDLFPTGDTRFGIKSQMLFYSHPTYFAAAIVFLLSLTCLFKGSDSYTLIFKNLIMLSSTLRIKALAIVAIFLILYWLIILKGRKITLRKWSILFGILLSIGWQQLEFYFITLGDESARSALLLTSFKIAKDFFPFGTGFGTFASYYSSEPYSSVYYMYNLNQVWGLSPEYHPFISDSFWPMIIGQFGIIGLTIYLMIVYRLFEYIQALYEQSYNEYFVGIFILAYLIISSTSESSFVNPFTVPLMFVLGLMYKKKREGIDRIL